MTIIWAGLAVGALYALVGLGYNFVFAASGVFNFAHGYLMMLGVFVSYWGLVTLKLPVAVVFLLSAAVVGLAGLLEERIAIRPVSSVDGHLVTTLGFATIIAGFCIVVWGNNALQVPFPGSDSSLTLLGGQLSPVDGYLIAAAVVLVIAVVALNRYTRFGLALLAVAEDREAAALKGIGVRGIVIATMIIAGAIAGMVGPLVGPKTFAFTALGAVIALKGFVAVAIGGFGSYVGGLIGGLSVGLVEAEASYYWGSEYANLAVFALLMAVLLLRPAGLFGAARERAV